MNSIVIGGDKGGEVRSLLLARKDISLEVYFLFLSYILNISFEENDIMLQYRGEFIVYNDSYEIILTASWRQYQNKPQPSVPFPISFPKTIVFNPSGAKTQKKEIMPYPRCGFGARLRCG